MMCAIALALIGQSRLDKDKCLGPEGESVRPATLPSLSDGGEMQINRLVEGNAETLLTDQAGGW